MTPAQFAALCQLLRVRAGPSRTAASLVLVDGLSQADAARQTGLTPSGVGKVVGRLKRGLELACLASGQLVEA